MEHFSHKVESVNANVQIAHFQAAGGVTEYHLLVRPAKHAGLEVQMAWVEEAYLQSLEAIGLEAGSAVFRRFFCSDLAGQADLLATRPFSNPGTTDHPCAVSWAGQPPEPPAQLTLWAYHVSDPTGALVKELSNAGLAWPRGELTHHWTTGLADPAGATAYEQMHRTFEHYEARLQARNMSLAQHAVRTWLFIRDIDADYDGVVTARREFFQQRGLTRDTHFIASTGIAGTGVDAGTKVVLDAYAIAGLRPEQVEYLTAPDHLGPTHAYGVTFERGTAVTYRDRRHVFISGTASIDPQGNILHAGSVPLQLDRAMANFEALLKKAGATLADLGILLAYVRSPHDGALVRKKLQERCGAVPIEVLWAPICRPGWLVEIEGQAIIPAHRPDLPVF